MYPEDGAGAETLVERADMAMYAVKQRKKRLLFLQLSMMDDERPDNTSP